LQVIIYEEFVWENEFFLIDSFFFILIIFDVLSRGIVDNFLAVDSLRINGIIF